jgi:hypothetical protein
MPKSTYEQGLCSKEGCGGFCQEEKGTHDIICLSCGKRWHSEEWETLVQLTREQEYDYRDTDRNLADLNSL